MPQCQNTSRSSQYTLYPHGGDCGTKHPSLMYRHMLNRLLPKVVFLSRPRGPTILVNEYTDTGVHEKEPPKTVSPRQEQTVSLGIRAVFTYIKKKSVQHSIVSTDDDNWFLKSTGQGKFGLPAKEDTNMLENSTTAIISLEPEMDRHVLSLYNECLSVCLPACRSCLSRL